MLGAPPVENPISVTLGETMKKTIPLLGFLVCSWALPGQDLVGHEDFLTDHETDLIRVTQEPNARIIQYLEFARLRLELVKQKLAGGSTRSNRSIDVHRNLEQFGSIIDAVDLVIDDAVIRGVDVTKGIETLSKQGSVFLADLAKITENPSEDHWRYKFVLENAVEITEDTIELAQGDLAERKKALDTADEAAAEKRLETMTPARREEVTEIKQEEQRKDEERQKKRPTLRKPGEPAKSKQ
jgi:hypothetical protein